MNDRKYSSYNVVKNGVKSSYSNSFTITILDEEQKKILCKLEEILKVAEETIDYLNFERKFIENKELCDIPADSILKIIGMYESIIHDFFRVS